MFNINPTVQRHIPPGMHRIPTGWTNATWTGSGGSDTFRCHYCPVAETVPKGQAAKNVRMIYP